VADRHGLTVRTADFSNFDRETEFLFSLYNRSFGQHPETTPLSWAAFAREAKAMRAIADPELIRIFEIGGQPVAFMFLLPNIGEFLPRYHGKITPTFVASLRRNLRRVRSAVIVMIGADPRLFGRGLGRCIVAEIARAFVDLQYDTVHSTWVHEGNKKLLPLVQAIGSRPVRRYAVFTRDIATPGLIR
jgi:hypothetical protein